MADSFSWYLCDGTSTYNFIIVCIKVQYCENVLSLRQCTRGTCGSPSVRCIFFRKMLVPCRSRNRKNTGVGQELDRCWSGTGQELDRSWSGVRQVLVRCWKNVGQILSRSRAGPVQVPNKLIAGILQVKCRKNADTIAGKLQVPCRSCAGPE